MNIYTTYFLKIAGVTNAFGFSVMVTCMGLIGVLTSFALVRYIDRRTVMLIGVGACGLCQLAFAIAWSAAPGTAATGRVVVALICLLTFFYVAYGMCSFFHALSSVANDDSQLLTRRCWAASTPIMLYEPKHTGQAQL